MKAAIDRIMKLISITFDWPWKISISQKNRSISVFEDKKTEVDFILQNVNRNPVFINDYEKYKIHLFSKVEPKLYTDNKENLIELLTKTYSLTKSELLEKEPEELKDIRDEIAQKHKENIISKQITQIKSYSLYSDIINTFNDIKNNEYWSTIIHCTRQYA